MRMVRKRGWKLAVCLFAAVWTAGCGSQTQDVQPTEPPKVTHAAVVPVENTLTGLPGGLKEDPQKKDASDHAKYNAMNRMIYFDAAKSGESLFCVDADTGIVYFVNQNKDFYIYRIRDGVTELAIPMPAKELYSYDARLYFMVESYGKYQMGEIKDGDIYCYTPKDGTVELVYALGEESGNEDCKMMVNENGIYFSYTKREMQVVGDKEYTVGKIMAYLLPFGEKEPVEDVLQMAAIPGWENYKLGHFLMEDLSRSPFSLISRTEGTKDYKELPFSPHHYCVIGDSLYGIVEGENPKLAILNVKTWEQEEYSLWEGLKKAYYTWLDRVRLGDRSTEMSDEEMSSLLAEGGDLYNAILLNCFTATDHYFWFVSGGSTCLIRIDKETKETAAFRVEGGIECLYTDGEQLYAMYALNYGSVPSLVKVLTDQPVYNEATGEEYVEVEYLTK